jgi:uncharacterized protein YciI
MKLTLVAAFATILVVAGGVAARDEAGSTSLAFDEVLAQSVGADDYGMKQYVLVILKTGPTPMPAGPERDEMFRGQFANMKRLAAEDKLVLAGPLDGVDGWRGLFILAVTELEDAEQLVATHPVVIHREMVAEYHKYYGTAALMLVRDMHEKLARKSFRGRQGLAIKP